MIGTTRSRVSFFMNRFRKHGFVEYNGRIRVHRSLLNIVLHDQLSNHSSNNSTSAPVVDTSKGAPKLSRLAAAAVSKIEQKKKN
jgi:CRP/FNR family transcriptional regulator, cyclic AMP receptor protein